MTTLTLIPQPEIGTVTVQVTPDAGEITEVIRSDVNGVARVRTLPGQLPSASTVTLSDSEAALAGPIVYEAIVAGGTTASETTNLDAAITWLTIVTRPNYSTTVELVTGYEAGYPTGNTVHEPIGRADPIVTIGVLGLRRGVLTYWCADYASVLTLLGVYRIGATMLMRQATHAGLDIYHTVDENAIHVSTHQLDAGFPIRWRVEVPYIEVRRPSDSLAGSLGWTFEQLAATYASFDEVRTAFASFDDLTVGPIA